jgi:hypothetical protein
MSGIFPLDSVIKTMIELGLEDIKKNIWLMNHILGTYTENKYLKEKYGQKQIDSCREWLLNNRINVVLRPRNDKDQMPLVALEIGNAQEREEMKHMADQSSESIILMPKEIDKPIPYVVKPFIPMGYDELTGVVEIDPNTEGLDTVSVGMVLVDPDKGQGFEIIDILPNGVQIEPNIDLDAAQLGILPQYRFYKARVEHTFFSENCSINCYAHGDPQAVLWLHAIVLYSILRYRESLLEANGFNQSVVSNGPLLDDPYYNVDGEQAFMRAITLTGQTEHTWIKSPRRFIENVSIRKETDEGFIGGLSIMSNTDPDSVDKTGAWYVDTEEEVDAEMLAEENCNDNDES